MISFTFHAVIVVALVYFAAREGLLGRQLKKIAVEMVKEKPPEKPKAPEPEKPKEEPPKPEQPKIAETPKIETPRAPQTPPPATIAAPPAVAPPAAEVPAFAFEGGKVVQSSSDPVQIYKGFVEYALRSQWNRPTDIADNLFVAEVELSVDRGGKISSPEWKKGSGNARWDGSVRAAIAATKGVNRPPPTNFPPRILVRFDVQEVSETFNP